MTLARQDSKLIVRQQQLYRRPVAKPSVADKSSAAVGARPVIPDMVTYAVGDGFAVVWELKYVRLNWIKYTDDEWARCVRFGIMHVRVGAYVTHSVLAHFWLQPHRDQAEP